MTRTAVAGVHRTKTHQYYFNGEGPWPGVTSITKVLDAPALTYWKMKEVALSAIENYPAQPWACTVPWNFWPGSNEPALAEVNAVTVTRGFCSSASAFNALS